jgi:hypothetical protein
VYLVMNIRRGIFDEAYLTGVAVVCVVYVCKSWTWFVCSACRQVMYT